ncbi:MAG: hypothetical protein H7270_04925 [Dermatophilaceae bacterium]|nr:hypothetical protein [Dermatophilaceae bacterium]
MILSRAMTQQAFEYESDEMKRCPGFRATIQDVLDGTGEWPTVLRARA